MVVANKSSIFVINKDLDKIVFPQRAFIDTNVVLDLYLNRQHKNDWLKFLALATVKGSQFVYSLHTLREVRNVINFQVHDKKAQELGIKSKNNTPAWKVLENDTRFNFSKDVTHEVKKVDEMLQKAGLVFVSVENNREMYELENLYSSKYDLGPGDAAIAATMDTLKINSICTNDAGFFKTDGFNIYSPTKKAFKVSENRNNNFIEFKSIKDE
jgi:predicted nucleic acid-binding protein